MSTETRQKRQISSRKSSRNAALERFKDLKSGKSNNKYDILEEKPIYEVVDEEEYSEIVTKRQKNNWIVDDDGGGGYVEDGREIFDDDLDDEADERDDHHNHKEKRVPLKRKDASKPEKIQKNTIKSFLVSSRRDIKPKKKVEQVNEDDEELLGSILSDINSNGCSDSTRTGSSLSLGLKLKRKIDSPHVNGNPFSVKKLKPLNETLQKKKNVSFDLDLDALFDKDEFDLVEEIGEQDSFQNNEEKNDLLHDNNVWSYNNVQNNEVSTAIPVPSKLLELLPFFQEKGESHKLIKFYWYDAYEDFFKNPGTCYLFGKVNVKSLNKYVSCCVVLKNIEKRVYLLPRKTHKSDPSTKVTIEDVREEFTNTLAKKFKITRFKLNKVTKLYAFEKTDVPEKAEYLEVSYPSNQAELPHDLEGETFKCVFGSNQSSLERAMLDLKLKGPSWLRLKNPEISDPPISWCKIEFIVNNWSKQISVDDTESCVPPFTMVSLNLRTFMNPHTKSNEILAISCLVNKSYSIDKTSCDQKFDSHFCVVTKPSGTSGILLPYDFQPAKIAMLYKNTKVELVGSEREMLNFLMAKFHQIDPDIIVGHDVYNFDLELILSRLIHFKVGTWSKLGKLKRSGIPVIKSKDKGGIFCGRLICDTKIAAKELIRAKSYDLTELVLQILKKNRMEIDQKNIPTFYKNSKQLFNLIDLTMLENDYALNIMFELNVMPLALQITKIAGNIFSRTLLGGRSERNEYLLLHAFHEKNYLVPDKYFNKFKNNLNHSFDERDNEDADMMDVNANVRAGTRNGYTKKKAAYLGGLVLEPKIGFYNSYILLMDFNSLYPSIIQEYNICFTTVTRKSQEGSDEFDEDSIPEVPSTGLQTGILPAEIKKLVDSRREVKKLLCQPNLSTDLRAQYDIKQKALKLTANSMYGCLGFGNSRFYAKPLAALITYKGREILMNTKTLVEKLGYEVIYGDTDSIMINTNTVNYDDVHKSGIRIQCEVNRLYKLLEIEIDGVYRAMLLLKKKKYAALSVTKKGSTLSYSKEVKGLDIVRRDWSIISKIAGEFVVKEILSVEKTDNDFISNIHDYLKSLADQIRNHQIAIEKFIITKQLTKNPEDYPDKKNLCHVMVAMRWNSNEKTGRKLRGGDTVPYVICIDEENPDNFNNLPHTQRAFHPEEVRSSSNLKIDVKYYLTLQILPVVGRLIEPIEGTDQTMIAECLGIESSVSTKQSKEMDHTILFDTTEGRYDNCKSLQLKCPDKNCFHPVEIRKIIEKIDDPNGKNPKFKVTLDKCKKCNCDFRSELSKLKISIQLRLIIRNLISEYYQNWMTCEESVCSYRTRRAIAHIEKKGLVCPECQQGILCKEVTDRKLFDQLEFFEKIFDVDKAIEKLADDEKVTIKNECKEYKELFAYLKQIVSDFKNDMAFSEVDLTCLFGGLNFKCAHK